MVAVETSSSFCQSRRQYCLAIDYVVVVFAIVVSLLGRRLGVDGRGLDLTYIVCPFVRLSVRLLVRVPEMCGRKCFVVRKTGDWETDQSIGVST